MIEHDFRYGLLTPQHTLTECRALTPGRYQVTGQGGSVKTGDILLVTLKGSRDLSMRLNVDKVRHMISPAGQWVAVARGPVFRELEIHQWHVNCDGCATTLAFEFAVDGALGKAAQTPAAESRIAELGWKRHADCHLCPRCQIAEAACVDS